MSKLTLFVIVLSVGQLHYSYSQRADIWQLGSVNVSTGDSYYLDFSNGNADTFVVQRTLQFFITNAAICDSLGDLAFYTNGVWIANRNHDTLFNSHDFNPGFWTDFYGDDGLGIPQGCLILPELNNQTEYWLFHVSGEYDTFYNQIFSTLRLGASLVDMNLDSGLGGTVQGRKNITILSDTLEWGRLTAGRHGNGRDWWLITHKFFSDLYYKVLVLPDTFLIYAQNIGNTFSSYNAAGMAVFSPDGTKYVHLNTNDTIDLLGFDRCNGEFIDFTELSVPDTGTLSATLGCSFSPNSRFLYVNTYWSLYQFDTWASDIQSSMMKVGAWEDQTGWIDWFFLHQLAPNGKIYISLSNGDHWMHVINDPDSLGVACNFEQHGLTLPHVASNSSIPNHPNYDLGPLPGSPCDTLYSVVSGETNQASTYRFQPNPVSDWLNIIYQSDNDGLFTLYNVNGLPVATLSLYRYFKNRLLDVSDLPQGIYFAEVTQDGEMVWSEKVVIQK